MQGFLALLGAHAAGLAALKGGHCTRVMWGGAGLLIGAVWPFTIFAMMPTNKKLLEQVRAFVKQYHTYR